MTDQSWSAWICSGEWSRSIDTSTPLLPALAHEAIAVAADPDVTITQLARVVSKDPAVATRVMQLANGAYSAPLQQVGTISDAIVRMGTASIRNLVIAASLGSNDSAARVYGPSGRDQLDHAVGTAYTAYLVAEMASADRDEAFLAGLLHDIGKLLLLKLAHDHGRRLGTPVSAEELNDVIPIEHPKVGALLLQSMRLPDHLVERVRWHHEPQSAPVHPMEAEVVYLADRLSHRYGFGCERDEAAIVGDALCARLHPTAAWLEAVDGRAEGLYAVARKILS